jgi:hypothetical protein
MAIFSQENNFCYFIHIPRTGGRYISSLFENSSNIECKYHKIQEYRFDGIDVTHLHYPLYNVFLGVENIPHLTVVRNPYDKFNSCLSNMHKLHGIDYNNILTSYDSFVEFVNLEINLQSYHNNWFLPQNKFISLKTHYWKYEWGFGKKFKKWVFDKTKIEIDLIKVEYERFDGETKTKYKLNKNIKGYVRKFYKEDYKKFNYFW